MGKKARNKSASGPRLRKELRPVKEKEGSKKGRSKHYIWIVLGVCLVSFFIHLNGADYLRRQGMITFDESIYSRLGFQLKNGGPYNTQDIYLQQKQLGHTLPAYVNASVFHHPPVFSWLVSLSYSLMEQKTDYSMEELYSMAVKISNLAGCGLILLVFLFGRRLFNPHVGLLAAVFMAFEFNLLMCSTKVWIDATLAFFVWLSLYLLYRSAENKYYFYAAGVTTGIALLTKYTAVLIFPIFICYAFFYRRDMFKCKEFYFFMAIAALIFSPWIAHNLSVTGEGSIYKGLVKTSAYNHRIKQFFTISSILGVLGVIVFALRKFIFKGKKESASGGSVWGWVGVGVSALFFGYLLLQKPFWVSFFKSWAWKPDILLGWKMGIYKEEPWYFYLKQHMEYSLLYVAAYIGFVCSFRRSREDVFLSFAAFWILLFGILWQNFQGRYVLGFTPAAMMLAAITLWRFLGWLWQKERVYAKVVLGVFSLVLIYVLLKTAHVGYVYCLRDSIAYF